MSSRIGRRRRRRPAAQSASQMTMVGQGKIYPYVFSAPGLMLVGAVLALPVLYAAYLSLFDSNLLRVEQPFVGLANYTTLFSEGQFWAALGKSATFVFGATALGQILAVVFAFALNRVVRRLRFLRAIAILPYIVSGIAAAVMFRIVFNREIGPPNQLLVALGLEPLSWLASPSLAMVAIIVAQVWADLPLCILIVLGGLQTINSEHLDAASVDGATGWSRAKYISLPMIMPQLVLSTMFMSYASLTQLSTVLGLTGGGPGTATQTLPLELYRTAFLEFEYGRAMAIAILLFAINACLATFYIRLQRKYGVQ